MTGGRLENLGVGKGKAGIEDFLVKQVLLLIPKEYGQQLTPWFHQSYYPLGNIFFLEDTSVNGHYSENDR